MEDETRYLAYHGFVSFIYSFCKCTKTLDYSIQIFVSFLGECKRKGERAVSCGWTSEMRIGGDSIKFLCFALGFCPIKWIYLLVGKRGIGLFGGSPEMVAGEKVA